MCSIRTERNGRSCSDAGIIRRSSENPSGADEVPLPVVGCGGTPDDFAVAGGGVYHFSASDIDRDVRDLTGAVALEEQEVSLSDVVHTVNFTPGAVFRVTGGTAPADAYAVHSQTIVYEAGTVDALG